MNALGVLQIGKSSIPGNCWKLNPRAFEGLDKTRKEVSNKTDNVGIT
jgi:hypothetical protein